MPEIPEKSPLVERFTRTASKKALDACQDYARRLATSVAHMRLMLQEEGYPPAQAQELLNEMWGLATCDYIHQNQPTELEQKYQSAAERPWVCSICGDAVTYADLRTHMVQHNPNAQGMDWEVLETAYAPQ